MASRASLGWSLLPAGESVTNGSWRTRLASAALLLVLTAGAMRLSYWLLAPAVPWLLVIGALAALYLFVLRGRR